MNLIELPCELLEVVCSHMDWKDVPSIRRTCRVLRQISYSHAVWLGIFRNFVHGGRMPEAYFLPKPLPQCSPSDLQKYILAWDARWPEVVTARTTSIFVADWRPWGGKCCRTTFLTPGGRWLVAAMRDSSVCYCDLHNKSTSGPLTPKVLIPPLCGVSEESVQCVKLDADFSRSPTYHLSEFTIAVATRLRTESHQSHPTPGQEADPTLIRVWRIAVEASGKGDSTCEALRVHQHLATLKSFTLDNRSQCNGFQLLGNHMAYVAMLSEDSHSSLKKAIEILDWSNPLGAPNSSAHNHSSPTHGRWLIPVSEDMTNADFYLLPEGRILLALGDDENHEIEFRDLRLYDYVANGHTTFRHNAPISSDAIWSSDTSDPPDAWEGLRDKPCLLVNGEAQFTARNGFSHLCAIRVPAAPRIIPSLPNGGNNGGAVIVENLSFNIAHHPFDLTHHNRIIDFERCLIYHKPLDDKSAGFKLRQSELDLDWRSLTFTCLFGPPLYDVFSNRIVGYDGRSRAFTVMDLLV
ncbi:hypothetical protein NMY22_g15158 [Coprinellus aureogranulatus]|nr:hypothetical protein NMY22_g15158 [Coprinellus aureogranulatus]